MFSMKKGVRIQTIHADGWREYPLFTTRPAEERDFSRIKEWGFDHVSAAVAEDALALGGLQRVRDYCRWAALHGLGLVLAVNAEQARALETELADEIVYAVEPSDYAAVRALNVRRTFVLHVGDPFTLANADILDDPHIVVGFSYDYPTLFTHQAEYDDSVYLDYFNSTTFYGHHLVRYPGVIHGMTDFLAQFPRREVSEGRYQNAFIDKTFLNRTDFAPVAAFRTRHPQTPLYCCSFGCNNYAPKSSRDKWTEDVISLLRQDTGGLCWDCYLGIRRGLVDPLDERLYNANTIHMLTYDEKRV